MYDLNTVMCAGFYSTQSQQIVSCEHKGCQSETCKTEEFLYEKMMRTVYKSIKVLLSALQITGVEEVVRLIVTHQ